MHRESKREPTTITASYKVLSQSAAFSTEKWNAEIFLDCLESETSLAASPPPCAAQFSPQFSADPLSRASLTANPDVFVVASDAASAMLSVKHNTVT